MDARNEILDAIQILIGRALESTTKIYNATCKGLVSGNVALMRVNGVDTRVVFYGDTPDVNKQYRVFVPEGNMSNAFMITGGGTGSSKPTVVDYNTLVGKPSINGTTVQGNQTSKDLKLYGDGNQPPYPVTSVNGQTGDVTIESGGVTSVNGKSGDVTLTASDVGALPSTTKIPSKTSELTNDSGYITAAGAPVQSVDGQTGEVVTNAVKTTAQTLTDAQKAQARTNIGAGTSSFSGAYDDLTGKPTIPSKTSELDNDSGFITNAALAPYAKTADVPTKTSQLNNDSGFVDAAGASAAAPVQSVNAKTGAVVLTQDDVGNGTTYVRTHNDFTDVAKQQINTNKDNITMLDSDMEAAQGDITTLKGNVTTLTTELQSKQDKITGGASTITDNNLVANRALVSNGSGKVAVSAVTATELGYLDGVTSNVQTQLNKKLESAPVTSVNTKTGAVVLSAADVGAVANSDVTQTLGTSTTKVPSEKAVADALSGAGAGDMLASVYDPNNKHQDIFAYVDNAIKDVKVTTDATPTQGSTNPVQSGGVYSALNNKLDKTGNGSNVTAAFTAASTRANVATGEKLSVLFGKIAKWFADLGSLAFKSTVAKSDLASDVQTELSKAGAFIVTVTWDSTQRKYVADQTYANLRAALNAGKTCIAVYGGTRYTCSTKPVANNSTLVFSSVEATSEYKTIASLTISSTDVISISSARLPYFPKGNTFPTTLLKGDTSSGLISSAIPGTDYIASGNIVKQTLVASDTTPTENYAINWVYG